MYMYTNSYIGLQKSETTSENSTFCFNDSGAQTDMFEHMSADASGSYFYANCAILHNNFG